MEIINKFITEITEHSAVVCSWLQGTSYDFQSKHSVQYLTGVKHGKVIQYYSDSTPPRTWEYVHGVWQDQSKILKTIGIDLDKIPTLHRTEKNKQYYVTIDELTAPIMKFDFKGKDCIAIAVHGHGNERNTMFKGNPKVSDIHQALHVYLDHNNTDHIFVADCPEVLWAYYCYHNKHGHVGSSISLCDGCEMNANRIQMRWLKSLIAGTNVLFKNTL